MDLAFEKAISPDCSRLNLTIMDRFVFQGQWNEIKGKLKQLFAELTEDDLLYEEGKEDRLIGRIQIKLGKSRDEVITLLRSF
jgi:uncharacterized protein YjbJ (UPF0337 family)